MCVGWSFLLVWLSLQAKETLFVEIPNVQFCLLWGVIGVLSQDYLLNTVGLSC